MSKPVLLIIDDEAGLAKLMKLNLELTGEFQVEVAHTSAEGIKLATEGVFDLVITDYRMPGLDGKAVARAIKQAKPNCPILLCTGDLDMYTEQLPDIDKVIPKPIDHKSLHGMVAGILARPT